MATEQVYKVAANGNFSTCVTYARFCGSRCEAYTVSRDDVPATFDYARARAVATACGGKIVTVTAA